MKYIPRYIHSKNTPCIICFQNYLSDISNCIFINNEYREKARIVATYSTTSGNIRMLNCYSDSYSVTENDEIVTVNCNLNYGSNLKINTISYVGLGPCLGNADVPGFFTPSKLFSKSQVFSSSYKFTKSFRFTLSDIFTNTKLFSFSDEFTNSNIFSKSNDFSNSNKFTNSIIFTSRNDFSNSKIFSNSEKFANSSEFNYSNEFSKTNKFSNSYKFTNSHEFSNSYKFTNSFNFSFSKEFTISSELIKSLELTSSNNFNNSNIFTNSNFFNRSNKFSISKKFTNSYHFSSSVILSKSISNSQFTSFNKTNIFTVDFENNHSRMTYSLTHSLTNVLRRSVSFSLSFIYSNSVIFIKNNNEYSISYTYGYFQNYFPYIIYYYSFSFTKTYVLYILPKSKRITKEQLIGIVCGSTSVFFFILGVVILALRKKNRKENIDFSISSSENCIQKDLEKEDNNKDEINDIVASSDETDLKFWL